MKKLLSNMAKSLGLFGGSNKSSSPDASKSPGSEETEVSVLKKLYTLFKRLPAVIKLMIIGLFGILLSVLFIVLMFNSSTGPVVTPPKVCDVSQTATNNANDSNVTGDWTKEGTATNKVAKEIWDFWNKKGYSAAAIAGVLGNVDVESDGFVPDRAQGGGSMMKDNPVGGGGGLYQFTSYKKFAEIGDAKWNDVEAQNTFVWNSEAHSFRGYATMTNVAEAAQKWFDLYERGDPSAAHMERRQASAQKAYEMWGSTASSTGSESVIGQTGSASNATLSDASAKQANDCQTQNGTFDGTIARIFDEKYQGLVLNAGLDDENHIFINSYNGGPGVHGPGAHDGWDINAIGDPGGNDSENIYAVAGGKIVGLNRGANGGLLAVVIQLENKNYLQYQEFKTGSIPSDLQKGQNIKAGTKIGEIGSAEGTGGVHMGKYVHVSYYSKDAKISATDSVTHYGSTKDTLSLGELLGIKADKWVNASQRYTWADMTAIGEKK